MDIDETIDAFRRGTLDIDCKRMWLGQHKEDGERFEGPGYIRQEEDGTLIFKLYVLEHNAKPFGHLEAVLSGKPGKVYSDDMFYDLRASAYDGTNWTADRILISPHWNFGELTVLVHGQMQSITARLDLPQKQHYLRLHFFEEYKVPLRYMSETEKNGSRFLTLDRAEFEACGSKFDVRKRNGSGDTVIEAISEAAFPVGFDLRIQEALQYITGKTAIERVRLQSEGDELHLELASPRRKSSRTQFDPPISPTSCHFTEKGWDLFAKYLTYVVEKTEGTHWNPVAYHLYNACESSANSVDAWAVGISVAVEAVSSLVTIEDADGDGQRAELVAIYQDRARKWLAAQGDIADIVDRVRGQIDAMSHKRAKDKLYALAKRGHVDKEYVEAWDYLRNRHVHPAIRDLQRPTPVDYQKLLDHIHRVEVLLRQLTFYLIGYEGPFTDYGAEGFPSKSYPLVVPKAEIPSSIS